GRAGAVGGIAGDARDAGLVLRPVHRAVEAAKFAKLVGSAPAAIGAAEAAPIGRYALIARIIEAHARGPRGLGRHRRRGRGLARDHLARDRLKCGAGRAGAEAVAAHDIGAAGLEYFVAERALVTTVAAERVRARPAAALAPSAAPIDRHAVDN